MTIKRIFLLQDDLMSPLTTDLATPTGKDWVNLAVDLTKEIVLQAKNSHLTLAGNSTNWGILRRFLLPLIGLIGKGLDIDRIGTDL